jgi:phosphoribosyl 1,2-cyclic phosphodiesterase
MPLEFHMLASGSGGNSAWLGPAAAGTLVDLGLGVRVLERRLTAIDRTWADVRAAVLTHVHEDHWCETSLARIARQGGRLFCHAEHARHLAKRSPAFTVMAATGLVEEYDEGRPFHLPGGQSCTPVAVSHDADPTFGFRFDGPGDTDEQPWSLAYAADLGTWTAAHVEAFANVDVFAIEFNHDIELQITSGRPQFLVDRVLGDDGHLSNEQGARLLRAVLERTEPGRLSKVVQLHLSRQCNHRELAVAAARTVLDEHPGIDLYTARQDAVTKLI